MTTVNDNYLHPPRMLSGMTKNESQWAFRLMKTEADGFELQDVSKKAWRYVLGYKDEDDACDVLRAIKADGIGKWIPQPILKVN